MAHKTMAPADETRLIDGRLGARIRASRRAARLSQSALAAQAGVTFQQLQKYERGTNRVAVSRLVLIGRALGTGVATLLGEAGGGGGSEPSAGAFEAMLMFDRCGPAGQTAVLELMRSLSTDAA